MHQIAVAASGKDFVKVASWRDRKAQQVCVRMFQCAVLMRCSQAQAVDASSSDTPAKSAGTPTLTPSSSWQHPSSVEPWEIDPEELEFVTDASGKAVRLGTGGCGDVRGVTTSQLWSKAVVVAQNI